MGAASSDTGARAKAAMLPKPDAGGIEVEQRFWSFDVWLGKIGVGELTGCRGRSTTKGEHPQQPEYCAVKTQKIPF